MKSAAKAAGMSLEDYQGRLALGLFRCTRCKTWKPRGAFGNDRSRPDGRDRSCFDCRRVKNPQKSKPPSFKGRKHSPEALALLAEHGRRRGGPMVGRTHTDESRAQMRETKKVRQSAPRGPAHYAWKGGAKARHLSERRSADYEAWRLAVYRRDKFTCQDCGDARGGNLNAHHIKPFADFPELRLALDNGVTLCKRCHDLRHAREREAG